MTLVTEKEAAEKWCPLMRAVSGVAGVGGKDDTMHPGSRPANMLHTTKGPRPIGTCIGSQCMAFRWVEPQGGPRHPDDHRERDNRGYCGAFGKVEP